MRILYLSDCYIESSIFASQVHSLCEHQCKFLDVTLLAHTHGKNRSFIKYNYDIILRRWIPNMSVPFIAAAVGVWYRLTGILTGYDVLHARGHVMSFVAITSQSFTSKKIRVIADIRGESAAEGFGSGSRLTRWLKVKFVRWIEAVIFKKSDHILFVSEAMAEHFCSMYKIPDSKVSVFPTLVNTKFFYRSSDLRARKRKELKINEGQFVYVYSGGISYWQNIDKIIYRFVNISKSSNRFVLLILTTAPDKVKEIVVKAGGANENIIVLRVPYEEVGAYLNAADAGLLIRDDSIINRVASPTKANEYVACGLPVIDGLEGIGAFDISPWIRQVIDFRSLDEVALGHRDIYAGLCSKDSV
ncbi:MAG: glycosyltransferase [Castellaniella sp.]|uniref:glycosyltransferase n=1 Tax=Castellaniella sp. TaxID=1955812 RepID=UPI003C753131